MISCFHNFQLMSSGLPTLKIIFSDLRAAQEQKSGESKERMESGKIGKVKWNPVTSREEYLTYLTQVVLAPCFN
jgi:hypothetical protein